MAEKTEQATPKKLKDARKKGQVAKSQDFSSAFTFVVSISATLGMSTYLYNQLADYLTYTFRSIKSAEQIGQLGINVVITGDLGPNATNVLKQLGIKSYHAGGNINNAIKDYFDNKLDEINNISSPHPKNNLIKKNSNEKIFFPLLANKGENSEISEHFGHAPFFGIYDVEKKELKVIQNNLDHTNPNKSPIDQIVETINPTIIYATGIGGRALDLIKQKGIKLKTSNYATIKEVIENLDTLSDQTSDCGH